MKKVSVLLLVLLGAVVVAAGSVKLLREAGVLAVGVRVFGPVLAVVVGLWIVVCAVECHASSGGEGRKS